MENKRKNNWKESIGSIDTLYWLGIIIAIVFFS